MKPVINGYEPKNKQLIKLKHKAWLQLVLNGVVSDSVLKEIRTAVSCEACEYNMTARVWGGQTIACRKEGIKERKYMTVTVVNNAGKGEKGGVLPPNVATQVYYCLQFEQKKED